LFLTTTDQVQTLQSDKLDIEDSVSAISKLYATYATELAATQSAETAQTSTEDKVESAPVVESTALTTIPDVEIATPEETKKPQADKAKTSQSKASKDQQFLRVPLDRLDGLVTLIGEMVVNRSTFNQRLADFEARIEDMNTSLQRFRNIAQEVETRYSVEALNSGRRTHFLDHKKQRIRFDGIEKRNNQLDELEFDRYTDFHLTVRSLSEATNDVSVITNPDADSNGSGLKHLQSP